MKRDYICSAEQFAKVGKTLRSKRVDIPRQALNQIMKELGSEVRHSYCKPSREAIETFLAREGYFSAGWHLYSDGLTEKQRRGSHMVVLRAYGWGLNPIPED